MAEKIVKKSVINIMKTSNVYLSTLLLGLSISIMGPCLLDLQRLVNTDTHRIALIYTSRSLGYLVGAILGGIVLDLVRSKMLVLTMCNFFVAATMFAIPWSRSVETLLGFAVLNGLSLGAMETGSNVVIIQICGSGPVLQSLYFTFGLGGVISPIIVAPFLEDRANDQNLFNILNYTSHSYFDSNTTTNFVENAVHEGIAKLTYPFSIVGMFALLVSTIFFVTWLISPCEDIESKSTEQDNSNQFSTIIFTFLVFFVVFGTHMGFAQILATYAVKGKLKATVAVASYMTSAYWAAFMTMTLACLFLSIKFSSMTLDILFISQAGLMLLLFMPNEGVLWAVAVFYGAGTASIYASLIVWLDNYIKITNKISAILTVGCAAGEMVLPFIITFFVETVPEMLSYVVCASIVVSTLSLPILHAIFMKDEKVMHN